MVRKSKIVDSPFAQLIKNKEWPNVLAFMKQPGEDVSNVSATIVKEQKGSSGDLPLHVACRHGAPLAVVQKMLEHYPEAICCTNSAGRLPLHELCMSGLNVVDDAIKFMYHKYTDSLTIADKEDGNLVLHLACRHGLERIIPFLCEAYPESIMTENKHGSIPLHRASSVEMIQFFHNKYPMTARVKHSGEKLKPTTKFEKLMRFMPKSDSTAMMHSYIR